MSNAWLVGLAAVALTALLAIAYRTVWTRFWLKRGTPTGFGVFLAPMMLTAVLLSGSSSSLFLALVVTTVGTFIYWLDDSGGLSARLRVVISFAAGVAVGAIYLSDAELGPLPLAGLLIAAGFVNVALVNTINFQDGADQNLATFILLTAALLMAFASRDAEWMPVAIACAAFTLPFAAMNSRPKTIYFGDSGSFAFAALFTILGAAFVAGRTVPPPEAAIPAALPLVDMAFVTALRIRIRQPFTTRHYFHLYQRLQKSRSGFFYLVPQVANVGLCVVAAALIGKLGVDRTLSVAIAMVVVTLPLFLFFRHRFVSGEPGPPLPREARA